MIVKIQPANPSILAAVRYNENKMDGKEGIRPSDEDSTVLGIEDGHVLVTRNVPEGSSLTDEFERLRLKALRRKHTGPSLTNVSFHMSVNPGSDDKKLSEEESVKLIDEIMTGLGYGNQPYRIYKHTDIQREHFHVVSTRAGQDGKKIDDKFERLRLRELLRSMEEKYGYEIILSEKELDKEGLKERQRRQKEKEGEIARPSGEKSPKAAEKGKKTYVPGFSRENPEPTVEQMTKIVEDAMQWHFSTFEQLQLLMAKRYNIDIGIENSAYGEERTILQGTDKKGEAITPRIEEDLLGINLLSEIRKKTDKEKMHNRREQRKRLEALAAAAAKSAGSYEDFLKIMHQKGVYVVLSWKNDDSDEAFGVTYLDRTTKCAWKGSETAVDLAWLKQTAQSKGWKLTADETERRINRKNARPHRQSASAKRTKTEYSPVARTGQQAARSGKIHLTNYAERDAESSRENVADEKDRLNNENEDKNIKYIE